MSDAVAAFRGLLASGSLNLPVPGAGETASRHRALLEFARQDLSLARLIEAHVDALAILADAGRTPVQGAWYGVWASDGPQSKLHAVAAPDGSWLLSGLKQYCSGAPYVTTALVTADGGQGVQLFEVDLQAPGIHVQTSTWKSAAFEDTRTGPVAFDGVRIAADRLVGGDNWYLERRGFWHGALGPAACWAGGACGLIDAAERLGKRDPHALAHRGALQAAAWALSTYLDEAGRQIDAMPAESASAARRRALKVRHLIERQCTEVLDRFGRATGPQLLAYDDHVARQHQELALYIRQCHGERDLAGIPPTPGDEKPAGADRMSTPMKPMAPMEPMKPMNFAKRDRWWPEDLGEPDASGSQNDLHYAYFGEARRLFLRDGEKTVAYDTGHHAIQGVSQASDAEHAVFTGNHGVVKLSDLVRL